MYRKLQTAAIACHQFCFLSVNASNCPHEFASMGDVTPDTFHVI
nr:hypothetical protein [Trichocoleus desertorum]